MSSKITLPSRSHSLPIYERRRSINHHEPYFKETFAALSPAGKCSLQASAPSPHTAPHYFLDMSSAKFLSFFFSFVRRCNNRNTPVLLTHHFSLFGAVDGDMSVCCVTERRNCTSGTSLLCGILLWSSVWARGCNVEIVLEQNLHPLSAKALARACFLSLRHIENAHVQLIGIVETF